MTPARGIPQNQASAPAAGLEVQGVVMGAVAEKGRNLVSVPPEGLEVFQPEPDRGPQQFAFHGSPAQFDRFTLAPERERPGSFSHGYGVYFAAEPMDAATHYRRGDDSNPGHVYVARIPADDGRYLDWNAGVANQSAVVRQALAGQLPEHRVDRFGNLRVGDRMVLAEDPKSLTGRDLYLIFKMACGTQRETSEKLHALGIAGVRYQDRGRRNFVVFDPDDTTVEERFSMDLPETDFASSVNRYANGKEKLHA